METFESGKLKVIQAEYVGRNALFL